MGALHDPSRLHDGIRDRRPGPDAHAARPSRAGRRVLSHGLTFVLSSRSVTSFMFVRLPRRTPHQAPTPPGGRCSDPLIPWPRRRPTCGSGIVSAPPAVLLTAGGAPSTGMWDGSWCPAPGPRYRHGAGMSGPGGSVDRSVPAWASEVLRTVLPAVVHPDPRSQPRSQPAASWRWMRPDSPRSVTLRPPYFRSPNLHDRFTYPAGPVSLGMDGINGTCEAFCLGSVAPA